MKAITFKEANIVFAKDQSEYKQLPAFRDENGIVVTCYKMSLQERLKAVLTGKVWLSVMTFGNSLHPQKWKSIKAKYLLKTNSHDRH